MKKVIFPALCVVILLAVSAPPARSESFREVWDKTMDKIQSIKDYQCILNAFIWNTPTAIKYRPKNSDGKTNVGNWYIFKVDMTWKEPGYSLSRILAADNPGKDLATKQTKKKPGTQIVYGFKDKTDLYGKFPKVGDPVIDKQVEKHIFHLPVAAFEGARPDLGFNQNIKTMAERINEDAKGARVEVDTVPMPGKKDFSFDAEKNKLSYESEASQKPFYRITIYPKTPAVILGATKEIIYINPATMLPAQLETYEGDKLVVILSIEDLSINTGVDDSLWKEYFKGATIYSPTGGK
jgi:hypothetical protein